MQIKQQSEGYTLIGLLLVIALLSVLFVTGIAVERQHTQNIMIAKTAMQVKQWLVAAMNFYTDNKQAWPTAQDQNTSAFLKYLTSDASIKTTADLPIGKNPWGFDYNILSTQTATSDQFTLVFQVPTNSILQRLSGLLPNPVAQDPLTLQISVYSAYKIELPGPPILIYQYPGAALVFHGLVTDGSVIPIPNCSGIPGTVPMISIGATTFSPVSSGNAETLTTGVAATAAVINWGSESPTSFSPTNVGPTGSGWTAPGTGYAWRVVYQTISSAGVTFVNTVGIQAAVDVMCVPTTSTTAADGILVAPVCLSQSSGLGTICTPPAGMSSCTIGFQASGDSTPMCTLPTTDTYPPGGV